MKDSFLNKIVGVTNSSVDSPKSNLIYAERSIPTNEESPKRFVSFKQKNLDEEYRYQSRARNKNKGLVQEFVDDLGMAKNGIEVSTDPLNLVEGNSKVVSQLSKYAGVTKVNRKLPPIIRCGGSSEIVRVSPLKLGATYAKDGLVYNWINRIVEYFLSAEPRLVSPNKHDQAIIDEWALVNNFRELLKLQFQHKYVYGNACWRWKDDESGQPINLDFIDPKFFDALRDGNGDIIYDNNGEPRGYIQYIEQDSYLSKVPADRLISQSPMFDYQSGDGMVFAPEEIAHMRLNRLGDEWWGIGQIEPAYVDVLNKKNAEYGFAETIQAIGYPRLIGKVGDKEHPPTQQKADDLWAAMDDLVAEDKVVIPHYDDIMLLESTQVDKVTNNLEYLKENVVTGMGGPKSLVTGSGEATNRSTLQDQKLWLERSLKIEQQDTSNDIRLKVLIPLTTKLHLKETPRLVWQEVSMESLDGKVDRIISLAKAALIDPTDPTIREYIKDLEDLPVSKQAPVKNSVAVEKKNG